MKISALFIFMLLVALPQFVSAVYFGEVDIFVLRTGQFIGTYLVPLVFAIALLVFIWGMFNYFIFGGADEKKREDGKALALYAIAGFVLMVVIWGIVNLLAGGLTSGLGQNVERLDTLPRTPTH